MSSTIGVQNIAHTNGTVAATISNGGVITFNNVPQGTGSMVKLLDDTMTNIPEYIITSTHINPTYNKYKLYFQITPATDGTYLYSYAYV